MNSVNNISLLIQALSLQILFQDYNNSDLMQELQNQDNNYLQKIIKQNEEIIELLKKGDQNGRQTTRESR